MVIFMTLDNFASRLSAALIFTARPFAFRISRRPDK